MVRILLLAFLLAFSAVSPAHPASNNVEGENNPRHHQQATDPEQKPEQHLATPLNSEARDYAEANSQVDQPQNQPGEGPASSVDVITIAIASGALAVSVISLFFAWRSADAAKASADAAVGSLDHAKETTAFQLRGYLFITGLEGGRSTLDFSADRHDPLAVTIANYGSTPVEITGMTVELIEEPGHSEREVVEDIPSRIVAAGKAISVACKMPYVQSDEIRAKKASFNIVVTIKYIDLFKEKHRSRELYKFDQREHAFRLDTTAPQRERT